MSAKRVGILTGGGDVPGLNSVIKSVVYRGSEIGCDVTGIRRGWEGLTHVNLDDTASRARYILPIDRYHSRYRSYWPPADHCRIPRAYRNLPHLRPRCRLHRSLYRLRYVHTLLRPRVQIQFGEADRSAADG